MCRPCSIAKVLVEVQPIQMLAGPIQFPEQMRQAVADNGS
jgi:hypothetical protein